MPLAQSLSEVPILGRVYTTVISGYSLPVYLAWLAVPLTAFVLARTRFGLRLWAVGESPEAVAAAGLSVARLRLGALAVNGALCGLAGVCLSMAQGNGFLRDMSAGRGYLALAALIFGKWRPWPVLGACLLFAAADAVQVRLQGANPARHRYGAGAANPGAALSDHSGDTGWFRRHGAPTAGAGKALFAGGLTNPYGHQNVKPNGDACRGRSC